jgi:hypothetical protein
LAKSNVYYSSQHQKVQALLNKLESYSNQSDQGNNTSSPSAMPWGVIVPLFLIGILLLSMVIIAWRMKRIGRKRKNSL